MPNLCQKTLKFVKIDKMSVRGFHPNDFTQTTSSQNFQEGAKLSSSFMLLLVSGILDFGHKIFLNPKLQFSFETQGGIYILHQFIQNILKNLRR